MTTNRIHSQKAQSLPLSIVNETLVITNVSVDNEDVVNYFGEIPIDARLERFEQALVIGTMALRTIHTYESLDIIEKRFNSLSKKFEASLDKTLEAIGDEVEDKFGERGDVKLLVEKYFGKDGEIPKLIQGHFGENGELIDLVEKYFGEKGHLHDMIEKYFGEKGLFPEQIQIYLGDKGKLTEILDPNKAGTPLKLLLDDIRQENQKLRDAIVEKVAIKDIVSKTTLKGYEFEDRCYEILCEIAKREHSSDIVETVVDDPSHILFKSKKGDFKIILGGNSNLRIVVEAKNYQSSLTFPEIKKTLTTAMKAREAQYGVLVVKDREALPQFVGYFKEFDNMLICALGRRGIEELNFEILDIAYKWAKMQALLRETKASKAIDGVQIATKLGNLKSELVRFQTILTQCDNVDKATATIREECSQLKSALSKQINGLISELA